MNFTDFILIIYLTPLIRDILILYCTSENVKFLVIFAFWGREGGRGEGDEEGRGEGRGGGEGRSFMANFLRQSLIIAVQNEFNFNASSNN